MDWDNDSIYLVLPGKYWDVVGGPNVTVWVQIHGEQTSQERVAVRSAALVGRVESADQPVAPHGPITVRIVPKESSR